MTVLLKEDGDKLLKEDGYAIRVEPYFILVDAGAGVDALANRGLALFEVGVGEELAPVFTYRDLFKSDTGLGTDLASLLAELVRADTGIGIDSIIAFLTVSEKFGIDSGTGVDISALKAYFMPLPDAGVGVEAIVSRALGRPDTGVGVDAKVALLATIVKSDTGVGADLSSKIFECFDTGVGTDTAILLAIFTRSDSGIGYDLSYMAIAPLKTKELVAVMRSYDLVATMRKYDIVGVMRKI